MFEDVRSSTKGRMEITFVTESLFDAAGRRPM